MASESGVSAVELITALLFIGILMGTAVSNLDVLDRPLEDGTMQTLAFLKQARARAAAYTLAHTVEPDGEGRLNVTTAVDCDAVQTPDAMNLVLPRKVVLTSTTWSVCFTPRGLATSNTVIELQDNEGVTRSIEVFLGGGMRVQS